MDILDFSLMLRNGWYLVFHAASLLFNYLRKERNKVRPISKRLQNLTFFEYVCVTYVCTHAQVLMEIRGQGRVSSTIKHHLVF